LPVAGCLSPVRGFGKMDKETISIILVNLMLVKNPVNIKVFYPLIQIEPETIKPSPDLPVTGNRQPFPTNGQSSKGFP
jgi:hypothetical protein